jgi:shikimate kinase
MQVFLIGLMGAGKTTVGKLLATRLGCDWLDSDKVLEQRCGVSVREIFELEGEASFRDREQKILDELTLQPNLVLSTGGGIVLREANRDALASRGTVVYLEADPHELWLRTRHDKSRPILQGADARQKLFDLHALRHPLYQSVAHITVLTGRPGVRDVVERVYQALVQPQGAQQNTEQVAMQHSLQDIALNALQAPALSQDLQNELRSTQSSSLSP